MSAIYRYLRGVDPATGEADRAERDKRLDQLDDAAKQCMETTPWRDYLLRVQHAGFASQELVASKNAIVNGYTVYICGRKAGVPKGKLDEMIARWVFGSLLTARYSGSSEAVFEQDLARVFKLRPDDGDSFVGAGIPSSADSSRDTRAFLGSVSPELARPAGRWNACSH